MISTEDLQQQRKRRVAPAIAMVVIGVVALAGWALKSPNSISFFLTPTELASKPPTSAKLIRVGGRVAVDTLNKQDQLVTFEVTDTEHQIQVTYSGDVPDTLKESTDVVAEGHLVDGVLVADRVMAKCSSKFVPATEAKARKRAV